MPLRGIDHYRTKMGLHVVRVHYTADPEKDPANPHGKKWFDEAIVGYPGGTQCSAWREEMEIDWDAAGGELVFPVLQELSGKIICDPFEIPTDWKVFGSFDYGHRNPASFHIYAMDFDDTVYTVWEMYGSGLGYREQAELIRACPYYDRLAFLPIADPSIFAHTQQSENEVKSIAQLFVELPPQLQIIFVPAMKGGDITTAEKIKSNLWADLDKEDPRWKIFSTCKWQIWELKKLRYADWSSTQMEFKNQREKIIDKDNHAWDDAKMFFNMFFFGPTRAPIDALDKLAKIDPISAEEWRNARRRLDYAEQKTAIGDFEV